jgi:hypothetical protein
MSTAVHRLMQQIKARASNAVRIRTLKSAIALGLLRVMASKLAALIDIASFIGFVCDVSLQHESKSQKISRNLF